MDSGDEYRAAHAALAWQLEAGIDEAIVDEPVNRYALAEADRAAAASARVSAPASVPTAAAATDPAAAPGPGAGAPAGPAPPGTDLDAAVTEARRRAAAAAELDALAAALASFGHCDLRQGARNTVFCDGNPAARVMIVGEAPGRDEDMQGKPFVGRAGQLLDRMFAAIGLSRDAAAADAALYISNVLPWRPPGNRAPEAGEIAMLLPFIERHVVLAAPEILVLMGNTPCQAILGRSGITRIRGQWAEALGRPVIPMFHPAYLLRQPLAKRDSWADLLALRAQLDARR